MKVIQYKTENKASILAEALVVLLSGGTVVYPTETAYGLGADFFSPKGYRSIFNIKHRDTKKALPVIVPDVRYATTLVSFTPAASKLAAEYWPGPLTLVLPFLYKKLYEYHHDPFLALRVSSHPFAASLSLGLGKPLVATSANASGSALCYTAEAVVQQLKRNTIQPDLIIDAGTLPQTQPSTIVKIDAGHFEIIRTGSITIPTKNDR